MKYIDFIKKADYIGFVEPGHTWDRTQAYKKLKSALDNIVKGSTSTPAKQLWLRKWDTDEHEAPVTYTDWKSAVVKAMKSQNKADLDELLYNIGPFYAQTGEDSLGFPHKDYHADPDNFIGTVYKNKQLPPNISEIIESWRKSKAPQG